MYARSSSSAGTRERAIGFGRQRTPRHGRQSSHARRVCSLVGEVGEPQRAHRRAAANASSSDAARSLVVTSPCHSAVARDIREPLAPVLPGSTGTYAAPAFMMP
jgi:hypothetical protein